MLGDRALKNTFYRMSYIRSLIIIVGLCISLALLTRSFAVQAQSPSVGAIFSSAQTSSRSFLRFYNTGTSSSTVTTSLYDYTTGTLLGQWTSPSIPAGSELQFPIETIESDIGIITKPAYYSLSIKSGFAGYFQHVLYRPSEGILTNLSTCDVGVTVDATKLSGVHSSIIADFGFPSSIVVNNTGATASAAVLGIYDARNGTELGTYTTASIPSHGLVLVTVASIESAARISPASGMEHYVISAQGVFTGFLQHLVNNQKAGVITDMTTACSLDGAWGVDLSAGAPSPNNCSAPLVTIQTGSDASCKGGNTHSWPVGMSAASCHGWKSDDTSGREHNNSASNIQCNGDGTFSFVQFAGNLNCSGTGVPKTFTPNTCAQDIPPTLYSLPVDLACCSAPGSAACKKGLPTTSVPGSSIYLNNKLCAQ